jgi:streptogramin lyase
VGPADSEGGITVSDDSVWIVTDKDGTLVRIDPSTNTVRQKVVIPSGSFNPLFSDGLVWITRVDANAVTMVDAKTGEIVGTIGVGPNPRFLTSGAGSIWTLNQGDGSVTRIDLKSRRVVRTIALGIPGPGGEICFGADSIWATMLNVPLTLIDTATNVVLRQWVGVGGDSVRVGHGSVWLTSLKQGLLWRIPLSDLRRERSSEGDAQSRSAIHYINDRAASRLPRQSAALEAQHTMTEALEVFAVRSPQGEVRRDRSVPSL